jgi:hypothetical protein
LVDAVIVLRQLPPPIAAAQRSLTGMSFCVSAVLDG